MVIKKTALGIGIGATILTGGTVAENATFERLNQYATSTVVVAGEEVKVKDRITDSEVTLNRWDGEESLTIKRQKDQTNIPFARLLEGSRKEKTIARATTTNSVEGFEFDIELTEKPDTNIFTYELEGWEDLGFFYQPELTAEEIEQGAERPENVVGSYAVYHKTKRNHVEGETNYQTGKLFHIYRPLVYDAEGNETWGELAYNEGVLTLTVPREFLDGAAYPVVADPTFGYTSVGASVQAYRGGKLLHNLFQAPENGSITSVHFASLSTSNTYNSSVGIYSSNKTPGEFNHAFSLLGYTEEITLNNGATGFHEHLVFGSPIAASSGIFYSLTGWLSVNNTFVKLYYDSGATDIETLVTLTYDYPNFTASPTVNPFGDTFVSIYATYEVEAPPVSEVTPPINNMV